MHYLVTYDIRTSRRRLRVARLLDDFGQRVQKSVFEIRAAPERLDWLRRRLEKLIDPDTDSVRLYPLCQRCLQGTLIIGRGEPFEEDFVWIA